MSFVENEKNGLVYMTSTAIGAAHGFTTRFGGVSTGYLESLNLGENRGDAPENVRENYRRLGEALGVDVSKMVYTKQVHGNAVRIVTSADCRMPYDPFPYEADGIVTGERGLALICFTADCVPVLLWDEEEHAIGAVHCGWRSTVADILGCAAEKLRSLGAKPEKLHAAIGPAIGKCCFETGPEVAASAVSLLGGGEELCPGEEGVPGKFMVDLRGVCRRRLIQLGLDERNIDVSDECTACLPDKYWSHRATHGVRGTQGSVIMLEETE